VTQVPLEPLALEEMVEEEPEFSFSLGKPREPPPLNS
jgi:hypothetical protein